MPARKTNTYSRLAASYSRNSDNRPTPDSLWEKAREYFQWVEDNPLKEQKVFSSGKRLTVNRLRAMTVTGFCVFAGIDRDVYASFLRDEAYGTATSRIADVIYTQKFEAAAAGLLETSIVSRELGLREQTDITSNGKNLHIEVIDKETKSEIEKLREDAGMKNEKL